MVTHDTGAAEHADRVLVCRDGRIVADLRGADQYALADAIRDKLGALGITIEDSPQGARWKK